MNTEERVERNVRFSTNMAFEQVNRETVALLARPTTEECEIRKQDFVKDVTKALVDNFTPEDRFEIFRNIRENLEKALKFQVEEMACKLESDVDYFENLKKLIY